MPNKRTRRGPIRWNRIQGNRKIIFGFPVLTHGCSPGRRCVADAAGRASEGASGNHPARTAGTAYITRHVGRNTSSAGGRSAPLACFYSQLEEDGDGGGNGCDVYWIHACCPDCEEVDMRANENRPDLEFPSFVSYTLGAFEAFVCWPGHWWGDFARCRVCCEL